MTTETLTPLWHPANGVMRVAGLMSGSGSNLRKIIEHEWKNAPFYHVAVIFSDNFESNALSIGKDYDISVVVRDKKGFYARRRKPLGDMEVRAEFDSENVKTLSVYDCAVAAYAGYMSIASPVLVDAFLGVNVHPADLSIVDEHGKRKYTGDNAVLDALVAGEIELRSSTHLITNEVDGGPVLMISSPIAVEHTIQSNTSLDEVAGDYQDRLKCAGDWVIFPKTLEDIVWGRFAKDSEGRLYFNGVRMEV